MKVEIPNPRELLVGHCNRYVYDVLLPLNQIWVPSHDWLVLPRG